MKTILLIEDNIDILANLTEYLELEGYKILGSNNGKKGIELAKEFKPDLIICNVFIKDIEGHALLRLLLDSAITSKIPFVFTSSISEKIGKMEVLKIRADDFIIKRFELETLLEMVKTRFIKGSK